MWLKMEINGHELLALVDFGSTHTFLAEVVAQRLGLSPMPRLGMGVMVVNGDQVTSSGICANTQFAIDHEEFFVDCYVVPLNGFDVVLIVQWLYTLGSNLWDFMKLTMSFWRDDHRVTWTGLDATPAGTQTCALTGQDLMEDLLEQFVVLFEEPHGLTPP